MILQFVGNFKYIQEENEHWVKIDKQIDLMSYPKRKASRNRKGLLFKYS